MLDTTIAGNLPKPLWLAETEKLSPAGKLEGAALPAGMIDALGIKYSREGSSRWAAPR